YTLPLSFVGYGITAGDLNYDDYADATLQDRIAVVLEGTPDGDNPHGDFARYTDVRWKAVAARDHGAKALVIIAAEDNFRDDRLSKLTYDNAAGDAGLPVIVISRQAAAQVLGVSGIPQLAELEKRVASAAVARRSATASGGNATYPIMDAVNKASFLEQSRLTLATSIVRKDAPADNIIGILEGSDPQLKKEFIVIGAHYDHLGRGGEGSLAARAGEVHHGADDNASGVAGVLELARLFKTGNLKTRRSLLFIAFAGEEEGLLGSNYYVNHPVVPLADTVAMVNMDMIGRLKDGKLIIGGVGTSSGWRDLLTMAARSTEQKFATTLNEDGYGPSDHSSFYSKQVPVLFFWTGTHEDYHKPSDTADKINYEGEAQIISLISNVVTLIDRVQERPAYAVAKSESQGRSMGFKVYLGTIPNYADSSDGLKLDGVRDDSPAAQAGLKGGDVIVKLAGRDVHNVYDYTYALGEMKAGVEYEVELMRGGERVKLKITPAARK
ncbi:MAG: M20/M25/M40 family metallo-hydrolase, partial [Acidobacteria bacterium]|nr:M20/M25/M40 family metallo-hydrolase [Acidobacteriota bacterium]